MNILTEVKRSPFGGTPALELWLQPYGQGLRPPQLIIYQFMTMDIPEGFIAHLQQYCDIGYGGTEFAIVDTKRDVYKWVQAELREFILKKSRM